MNDFDILTTLPHHSAMGAFENPKSAPVWQAQHGFKFTTEQLADLADRLLAANARNDGVEWGDVRSRHINSSNAGFLRFVVGLRTR